MSNVLVVAELGQGTNLKNSTLSAISFAKTALSSVGGSLDILVLGSETSTAAKALSLHGARQVIRCDDPSFENYTAEHFAPTVAQVAADYSLIVAAASTYGKDLLPRVAGRIDAAYAGDCADLKSEGGELCFKRPMFAGNALGFCTLTTGKKVATVRQSEVDPDPEGSESCPQVSIPKTAVGAAAGRVEFVSLESVTSTRPELTDARVIVSGGRALKEKFFEVLEPLADKLGSALGASRAAVDAGYCPGDFQVGQTGKIVAPDLYFAIGISGAIQHVAGMKNSKVIVAINKDPDAPIFQIADYGLVADLFDAVPLLVSALPPR